MGHGHVDRGTPTVRAPGWDPTTAGRTWTSRYYTLDSFSSRIAPDSQRMRDGQVREGRAEKLLSKPKQWRGLGQHPEKFKDGSPREVHLYISPTNWMQGMDYTSTMRACYQAPGGYVPRSPRSETREQRAERYSLAARRRISPAIYYNVYNREPGEAAKLPDETMAMPPQSKVSTRGAASTPTRGHWAEPNLPVLGSPRIDTPAASAAEEEYRRELVRARIRSERRLREAALAIALDIRTEAAAHAHAPRVDAAIASGSLSART